LGHRLLRSVIIGVMTRKSLWLLPVLLFFLATSCLADLYFSYPIVGRQKNKIEVGSSPEIAILYNNTTTDVKITQVLLTLVYDPNLIDGIIVIKNENPNNFRLNQYETIAPGKIILSLDVDTVKPKPLKVEQNQAIKLITIICHINQAYTGDNRQVLFSWLTNGNDHNSVLQKELDVTGNRLAMPWSDIKPSKPPEFSGLNQVVSRHPIWGANAGNTIMLDWGSAAGAYDNTKSYNGKLTYRVYLKVEDGQWEEQPSEQPVPDPRQNPADRSPFLGNIPLTENSYVIENLEDGKTHYVKVTASDDTSPLANEQQNTAILSVVPVDTKPPGLVHNVTSQVGDHSVLLKWENPKDNDFAGVVILKRNLGLVPENSLGGAQPASPYKDGPEYSEGETPFGAGQGTIIFVSPPDSPEYVPTEFQDVSANNGVISYYRIYTYDYAADSPRDMGRNYSQGVPTRAKAGIVPRAITNFKAEAGSNPGEVLLSWNNSVDDFVAGVLVRFSDDDRQKFAGLDINSGVLAGVFQTTLGPGEKESKLLTGFATGHNYYFKALAYNQTANELDLDNDLELFQHLFSLPVTAQVKLPYVEPTTTLQPTVPTTTLQLNEPTTTLQPTVPTTTLQQNGTQAPVLKTEIPSPEVKIWFGSDLFQANSSQKFNLNNRFIVKPNPTIKVRISVNQPFAFSEHQITYKMIVDNATVYSLPNPKISQNEISFEKMLLEPLTPGDHTFHFLPEDPGLFAANLLTVKDVKVYVAANEVSRVVDIPISFPSPFNPEKDGEVSFQYTLSKAANIDIYIFDATARIVARLTFQAGANGGQSGQNTVKWDGKSDQGAKISNGIYFINIVSRDENRAFGKIRQVISR